MEYNIVTSLRINNEIKKCKYYKISLGFISSDRKPNHQVKLNELDNFAYFYNKKYKTTIYGQGLIGDISFYTDHNIKEHKIKVYYDRDEYIFDFDYKKCQETSIESYLGFIIKEIETKRKTEIIKEEILEEAPKGNYMKVINTPWDVTYDDILAYNEAVKNGLIK